MDSFFENEDELTVEEKIKSLSQKIASGSEDYFLHKDLAKNLLKIPTWTNTEIGLESINKFLQIKPDDFDAKIIKCRCLRFMDKNDQALSILEKLKENYTNTLNPDIENEIGRNLISKGNYKDAKAVLIKAHDSFSSNTIITRSLVSVLECLNDYEQAFSLTNELLENNPDDIISIQNKINLLMELERFDDAINYGEKIRKSFPGLFFNITFNTIHGPTGIWNSLTSCYIENAERLLLKSDHHRAKLDTNLELVVNYNLPNDAKTYLQNCLDILEQISEIIVEKKINISEKNLLVIKTSKIICYGYLDEYNRAIILCDEILNNQINHEILFFKGVLYFHLQRYPDAIEILNALLENYPDDRKYALYRLFCSRKIFTDSEFNQELNKFYSKFSKDSLRTESLNTDSEILLFTKNFEKHSNFFINITENKLRDFIFSVIDIKMLKQFNMKECYDYITEQKNRYAKKIFDFPKKNDGVYLTFGYGKQILANTGFQNKLKEKSPDCSLKMTEVIEHITQVLNLRNPLDHSNGLNEKNGDLPVNEKALIIGHCNILDLFFDKYIPIILNSNSNLKDC